MATLRRTVLVARMGSPFTATLASSLSQTGVLSDAENYRLGHGNLPEWQRKIPHATVVALAHALCAVSWSRKRDRRTRKGIAAGGHDVGCDSSARRAGLSRCAGALPRAGVPRVGAASQPHRRVRCELLARYASGQLFRANAP